MIHKDSTETINPFCKYIVGFPRFEKIGSQFNLSTVDLHKHQTVAVPSSSLLRYDAMRCDTMTEIRSQPKPMEAIHKQCNRISRRMSAPYNGMV